MLFPWMRDNLNVSVCSVPDTVVLHIIRTQVTESETIFYSERITYLLNITGGKSTCKQEAALNALALSKLADLKVVITGSGLQAGKKACHTRHYFSVTQPVSELGTKRRHLHGNILRGISPPREIQFSTNTEALSKGQF